MYSERMIGTIRSLLQNVQQKIRYFVIFSEIGNILKCIKLKRQQKDSQAVFFLLFHVKWVIIVREKLLLIKGEKYEKESRKGIVDS